MKAAWKDYFAFNKRHRNGILVLLVLLAILLIYLFVADYFPASHQPADFFSFKTEIDKNIERNRNMNIDINTADTTVLMTLPKMTSLYAEMIMKERKKLGGYYTIKQLKEVLGMDSMVYNAVINKVWADTTCLHKININKATIKQLARHPYIHTHLAKAIVSYREQHGLFKSLFELHAIAPIDDSVYKRIAPYLTLGRE